jgi:hypothetical protein
MRHRMVATAALAGVAVIAAGFVATSAGALAQNTAMLDDGTCGHPLQLGSDPNASSSIHRRFCSRATAASQRTR